MDERSIDRPLAEDQSFLDRLEDLDRGLPSLPSAPEARLFPPTSEPSIQAPPSGTFETESAGAAVSFDEVAGELQDLFFRAPSGPNTSSTWPVKPPHDGRRFFVPPARVDEPDASTYGTFYGFDEPPFSRASDLTFLYHSNAQHHAAQALLTAIGSHERVVAVVTGQVGVGKTMLCRAVMEQLDRRTFTCLVEDPLPDVDDLLKAALVDFGVVSRHDLSGGRLAAASRTQLLATLGGFLDSLEALGASALIVIDQAHALSSESLQQIALLTQSAAGRNLQTVLVANPELRRRLKRRDLRPLAEQITTSIELSPLEEHEIRDYITHRLNVASSSTRVQFDDQAYARIFEISKGLPRVVNELCEAALRLGFEASVGCIDRDLVDQAAAQLGPVAEPSRNRRVVETLVLTAVMIVMMLAGAAGAAWVFREDLTRVVAEWSATHYPVQAPAQRAAPPARAVPPPAAPK